MPLEDIPKYLRLTPESRKAAWEKHRVEAKPLPPETLPTIRRIQDIPGAKHGQDSSDDT